MIRTSHLKVDYGAFTALNGIDLNLPKDKLTVLIGPNGAGKTSLIKAMAGLIDPSFGEVFVDQADLKTLMPQERAKHISYLAQERTIAWDLKAVEIAALGGVTMTPEKARHTAFQNLMALGLQEVAERTVFSLSGGQRSRVLLARALTSDAYTYLMDEPLIALDPAWQRQALSLLKTRANLGASVCLSLHDLHLAAQFADHILVMHQGRIVVSGCPTEVFKPEILREVFQLDGHLVQKGDQMHLSLSALPLGL